MPWDTKETDFERFEFAGRSDVRESKRRCLMNMIDQRDFDVEQLPENFEMKNDYQDEFGQTLLYINNEHLYIENYKTFYRIPGKDTSFFDTRRFIKIVDKI